MAGAIEQKKYTLKNLIAMHTTLLYYITKIEYPLWKRA